MAEVTGKLYQSDFRLFSTKTLRDILEIEKESTFFSVLRRLISGGVLHRLERDVYVLKNVTVNNFSIANALCTSSYISFESALNFYGVLSQFPHETTSATVKKGKEKTINGTVYSYAHIQRQLFWGYRKSDWLIAEPEKALLDQAYLWSKGLKMVQWDEYDCSSLSKQKIRDYMRRYPHTRQFAKAKKELERLMRL